MLCSSSIASSMTLFLLIALQSLKYHISFAIASFPGPAQLSVAYSTVSDGKLGRGTVSVGKLGGAWE